VVNKDISDDNGQIKDVKSAFKTYQENLHQVSEQLFRLIDETTVS
jgi:hypothetical protein